jgi:hypothetical protein
LLESALAPCDFVSAAPMMAVSRMMPRVAGNPIFDPILRKRNNSVTGTMMKRSRSLKRIGLCEEYHSCLKTLRQQALKSKRFQI